jgi:2-oxoisovalerate dehydrogenase E1 component|tara:strand:- start:8767 stop:11157 length:2391 start_codon:yes stop_codon:yes gene_type:complete
LKKNKITFDQFQTSVLEDYRIICESREASLLGRKEVLTGKAKFGIFGDGKELAQIAMARTFQHGDFRSGYYRDQTFMMAIGELTINGLFSQLYANTDLSQEPSSGGRQMNNHFATRSLNNVGQWKNLTQQYNSASDISPTGSQMPRLLGLGQASKIYRNNSQLNNEKFSVNGDEIAFGTIGNASTSEGLFFETINAAGVLQIPILLSIWDDGWGISVPSKYQTTKGDISEVLKGFQRTKKKEGIQIYKVNGWDYSELCATYMEASKLCRNHHIPVIIHVKEMTQPQGHSTSGSHERYKTQNQLNWEKEFDCIKKMKEWILEKNISTKEKLETIEKNAKNKVKIEQKHAWDNYLERLTKEKNELINIINTTCDLTNKVINESVSNLNQENIPSRGLMIKSAKKIIREIKYHNLNNENLENWLVQSLKKYKTTYSSHLYSESSHSILNQNQSNLKITSKQETKVDGRIILRDNFNALLKKHPELLIFGEDSGKIGDVNQGLEGLQATHGEDRVSDTGIREATIIGQGIGLAMRGLRPIAEIQYLDYLLYAIQIISDDLATLQYRTVGGQKAPLIIRTRGHRLEGIWHSGSPMGGIINLLKGVNILVPRNMTKAAGFYNHLLIKDEPALVIECLNGYRLKEILPDNLGEFYTEIGIVETIQKGTDITLVTYGSCCRIALKAAEELVKFNISIEIIDVQSLIPFDINNDITKSIKKTNRVVFFDEDVSGGATAFMMQKVLEEQNGYNYLDSPPKTITSKDHRTAYGDDGDYFSKSNMDNVIDTCYEIMHESSPEIFPKIF